MRLPLHEGFSIAKGIMSARRRPAISLKARQTAITAACHTADDQSALRLGRKRDSWNSSFRRGAGRWSKIPAFQWHEMSVILFLRLMPNVIINHRAIHLRDQITVYAVVVASFLWMVCYGFCGNAFEAKSDAGWKQLAPFFNPPPAYSNEFDSYK